MNWFEAFGKRLFKQTPAFFTKIIYFGVTLGTIGAGLILIPDVPQNLKDWADNFILIGTVAAVVAKATVKHPETIKK